MSSISTALRHSASFPQATPPTAHEPHGSEAICAEVQSAIRSRGRMHGVPPLVTPAEPAKPGRVSERVLGTIAGGVACTLGGAVVTIGVLAPLAAGPAAAGLAAGSIAGTAALLCVSRLLPHRLEQARGVAFFAAAATFGVAVGLLVSANPVAALAAAAIAGAAIVGGCVVAKIVGQQRFAAWAASATPGLRVALNGAGALALCLTAAAPLSILAASAGFLLFGTSAVTTICGLGHAPAGKKVDPVDAAAGLYVDAMSAVFFGWRILHGVHAFPVSRV